MFLANYADGLANLDLNNYLDLFRTTNKTAGFLCVQPSQTFHVVSFSEAGEVQSIAPVGKANLWINGGLLCIQEYNLREYQLG